MPRLAPITLAARMRSRMERSGLCAQELSTLTASRGARGCACEGGRARRQDFFFLQKYLGRKCGVQNCRVKAYPFFSGETWFSEKEAGPGLPLAEISQKKRGSSTFAAVWFN
jgi:hypothetical protein